MIEERTFTIDGKEYKESDLSLRCRNIIVARAEIQQSKTRHEIELEKIDVLTAHYNNKIQEGIQQFNGSSSKS